MTTAGDLVESGQCTPMCLLALTDAACQCRCGGVHHGAMTDAPLHWAIGAQRLTTDVKRIMEGLDLDIDPWAYDDLVDGLVNGLSKALSNRGAMVPPPSPNPRPQRWNWLAGIHPSHVLEHEENRVIPGTVHCCICWRMLAGDRRGRTGYGGTECEGPRPRYPNGSSPAALIRSRQ